MISDIMAANMTSLSERDQRFLRQSLEESIPDFPKFSVTSFLYIVFSKPIESVQIVMESALTLQA